MKKRTFLLTVITGSDNEPVQGILETVATGNVCKFSGITDLVKHLELEMVKQESIIQTGTLHPLPNDPGLQKNNS